jgi:hypothetical protein
VNPAAQQRLAVRRQRNRRVGRFDDRKFDRAPPASAQSGIAGTAMVPEPSSVTP